MQKGLDDPKAINAFFLTHFLLFLLAFCTFFLIVECSYNFFQLTFQAQSCCLGYFSNFLQEWNLNRMEK